MKNGVKTYGVLAALASALVATPSLAKAASSYNVDISISFGPTASVVMKHAQHKGRPVPWVYADPRNRPPGPPKDPKFAPKPQPKHHPQPVPPPKVDSRKKAEPPKASKPEPQKPQAKQPEPKKTQPKQPQAKPQAPRR